MISRILMKLLMIQNSNQHANAIHNRITEPRDALARLDANKNPIHPTSIGQKRLRNPGKNSIPSIIGGYKSAVTKHANRMKLDFGW